MLKISLFFRTLMAVVVVCFLAPVTKADLCGSVAGNLVENCGFETGTFSGWTLDGNTSSSGVFSSSRNSGDFGARFSAVSSFAVIQQNILTVPGELYTLSFYLANDGGTPNQFFAFFGPGPPLILAVNEPAFGFTQFTTTGLVATDTSTQIEFLFQHNASFWHFDDVVLMREGPIATPEPTSLILMGSGLAGFGMYTRRRFLLRIASSQSRHGQ